MIIKNIFDGTSGKDEHIAFLKFGRGTYKNKYVLEGKKQAKNFAIKTGAEYANFLVRRCLEKINGKIIMTGAIISTLDLKDDIKFNLEKVSNFQGVRKYIVKGEIENQEIFELMDKYPKAFFALSFKGDDFVLKIKVKAPTSGKPGKGKDNEFTADFCSLKIKNKEMVNELFFGIGDFETVKILHEIDVTDIIYPDNMNNLKPEEIREMAKRKGIIKRIAVVDGIERVTQAEFIV